MALKNMMKDTPIKRNLPTVPAFKIKEQFDVADEKKKWIDLLDEYEHYTSEGFMHPFFGAMTKENTGYMVYKHADHHLQQFGS
jgi:hypothetical protein